MSSYGLFNVHESPGAKSSCTASEVTPVKTWTKNSVFWPRDLLPKEIPEFRVFLFGYDSSVAGLTPTQVTNTSENRPIIFIAHSLGGLVAAQVLVLGDQKDEDSSIGSVTQNLRGLIFLGTPFRGSRAASLGENVRRILQLIPVTQKDTLKLLEPESHLLRQLPGCGDAAPIHADHVNICKFGIAANAGFGIIMARIRKMMAPSAPKRSGHGNIFQNYGKVANQAMGDISIHGQTLNF
ncbi:hypothetical protein F5Y17DRAFT_459498 [Xylariaceae sp. FL0594]|nr:hypothetical protein F5Y17DRAFT_459498 [Xylariaceae sp. FL0594]